MCVYKYEFLTSCGFLLWIIQIITWRCGEEEIERKRNYEITQSNQTKVAEGTFEVGDEDSEKLSELLLGKLPTGGDFSLLGLFFPSLC